jgi:UDP-glucose 4-epimerase
MNVLITGATGFVGSAVINKMLADECYSNLTIRVLTRRSLTVSNVTSFQGSIDGVSLYNAALDSVDVVVHIAAIAHAKPSDLNVYNEINALGSVNLARQAAAAGVKRFVFISSIGVNGGLSSVSAFKFDDEPSPWDDYSRSKYEAEQALWRIQGETGLEIVIIRPPLVYGPSAPGNFAKLISVVNNEKWLPLGAINNQRSFVALDNLVDLIITCINHPKAANQTFLVSDDENVSTTELLKKMASAFGKKSRLIPLPMGLIRLVASLLGKRAVAQRLCSSLVVDISHTKETLNWKPPVTMEQQLAKIAASLSQLTPDN